MQAEAEGEFLVSRYAAGWRLVAEAVWGKSARAAMRRGHVVEHHKELLLLVLTTAFFASANLVSLGLRFLVPLLVLAGLKEWRARKW